MRCIERSECVDWMQRRVPEGTPFELGSNLPQLAVVGYEINQGRLPLDSGAKVDFARRLCHLFREERSVFVYLQNCCIFPSSGHMPILKRWRSSFGEIRSVEEAPGFLFEPNEADDFISVVVLALEFFWDCLLMGNSGQLVCYISHDEYCDILSHDRLRLTQISKEVFGDLPPSDRE